MDLTKHAPRSPYHIGISGMMNLARMADKAIAKLNNTLGEYKSGETSGRDRRTLSALGLSEEKFLGIIQNSSGADGRMGDTACLLYTSPSPRDLSTSRMPSSA